MAAGRVARDTLIVMGLILISRILGFVRERAAGEVFGMTWETDAFRAAFNIPDLMFFLLVGGALNAAFIPVFTGYLARGEEDEGWRVAATFFNAVVLLLVASMLAGILLAPWLAPLVAYKFQGEQRQLLIYLMRLMFPAVFFTALAGLASGVHRSYQKFTVAMIGPIIYNVGITLGAYVLGPRVGIVGMAIGTVVGAMANFLVQLPFVLRKAKGYQWRIDWHHPALRRIAQLSLPAIVSLSISRINVIIGSNLASGLPEGSLTALNVADRVIQLPLGVFAMGMSTVLFPALARQAAMGEQTSLVNTFGRSLRTLFFLTVPAAAGLMALGEPVIRLLFEAGAFGPRETQAAAFALFFYSFGLFAQSATQIMVQVFYSVQDTLTPVRVGVATVAANTLLSILLLHTTTLLHGALALSFALSSILQMTLYLLSLRAKLGSIQGRALLRTLISSAAASAVMALVARLVSDHIALYTDLATLTGRFIQVVGAIGAGALVYGLLALALRMEEARWLLSTLRRRGAPVHSEA